MKPNNLMPRSGDGRPEIAPEAGALAGTWAYFPREVRSFNAKVFLTVY